MSPPCAQYLHASLQRSFQLHTSLELNWLWVASYLHMIMAGTEGQKLSLTFCTYVV